MKDGKAKRHLEEWKQELESRIAATDDLLTGSELVRILAKLGIHPSHVPGRFRFEKKRKPLTTVERRRLRAWLSSFRDKYDLERIELILHQGRGRGRGSKNKQPKPLDPKIATALSKFRELKSLHPNWSDWRIALKLAAHDKNVADRIRKAREARKARYRKLAEAMA